MAGIFPNSGVVASDALNTVNTATDCESEELWHSTSRCTPRFDPAAANAVMSELLNLAACFGHTWDCGDLNNLCQALSPADIADITCEMVAADTGITTEFWVSSFINQGMQFRSGTITAESTTCNRAILSATNVTVSGANSVGSGQGHTIASANSYVNGIGNTTDATTRSVLVSGDGNDVTGVGLGLTVGDQNQDGSRASMVSGTINIVSDLVDSSVVGGRGNQLIDGDYNAVFGRENIMRVGNSTLVTGNTNDVSSDTGFIVAGGGNQVLGAPANGLVVGQTNIVRGNADASVTTGQQNDNSSQNGSILGGALNTIGPAAINRHIIGGTRVVNPTDHTIAGGRNDLGVTLSSNRRWDINSGTGDIRISGALTAGFVFPGFGEYYCNPLDIEEGYLVTSDDGETIRLAEAGDDIDGITRKQIAISPGGGVHFDNSPYLLDKLGNRRMDPNGQPMENPDFDAEAHERDHHEKMGVEMLGRTFVRTDKAVKQGDHLAAGKAGIATISTERTNIRVHNYKDGIAFVTIK